MKLINLTCSAANEIGTRGRKVKPILLAMQTAREQVGD